MTSYQNQDFPFLGMGGILVSGNVYNVLTYGATGNGSTDDTASINAAYNALVNAGGGILYFPKGTYGITSALQWGNGSGTQISNPQVFTVVGAGSGGGVTGLPAPGSTSIKWIGATNSGPMLKILGPITVNMQGILFDGNNKAQDGIWEIYQHGATWYDVFIQNTLRAQWFRTRWLTNPPNFGEGSSSNVFINCGGSSFSQTGSPGSPIWQLIMGGNPNDPTDRTSANVSDPYNSVFIKPRFRADGSTYAICCELRFTDSNTFIQPDFASNVSDTTNSFSVAVAQNPNYTSFPTAFMYAAAITNLGTVGTYVNAGANVTFDTFNGGTPIEPLWGNGVYFPWARIVDYSGRQFKSGGVRSANITLRALETGPVTVTPAATVQTQITTHNSFQVYPGDWYQNSGTINQNRTRVKASGTMTTGSSTPTLTLQLYVGSTLLFQTPAVACSATTTANWMIDVELVPIAWDGPPPTLVDLAIGDSRYAIGAASSNPGVVTLSSVLAGYLTAIPLPVSPNGTPFKLYATFSAGTGNTITLTSAEYFVEYPDPDSCNNNGV